MRVVIAESHPSVSAELQEALGADGRFDHLEAVVDGDSAARSARDADVVVIDLCVGGRGSLGTIGSIHRLARPPVIVGVTTAPEPWRIRAARVEGADAILDWPADKSRIIDCIAGLLAERT